VRGSTADSVVKDQRTKYATK